MALQKVIKLAIFLVIALVVFNVLKKQSFFKTEPGKISSDTVAASNSNQGADETQIQNEQIKAQMHRLTSSASAQYIAGCMKTPAGCKCYDAKAKPVKVTASICAQNVRDASGNQHKVFNTGNN
jgi:hypothetical protein